MAHSLVNVPFSLTYGNDMCRLVAYLGPELLLEDILVKPINSIIMQSLHARESQIPTNGDGFGLGWYAPEISPDPAVFTSIFPAWNDQNLLHLTAKIKSPAFFAHVRAASSGGVSNANCHPFIYGPWMLMHNGEIHNFIIIKRHLRHLLDDDIYHWIQGETDSEHLFALFLQLAKGKDLTNINVVADILELTLYEILQLVKQFSKHGTSFFNICLTDGKRMVATRYSSTKKTRPESMHYSLGSQFIARDGNYHMVQDGPQNCILVTSEKLNNYHSEWNDVPINHLMIVNEGLSVQTRSI
jgi:glutamine amidotransferase